MRSRLPMAPRRRRRPTVSRIRSNRVAVRPFPTGFSCRSTLLSIRSISSITEFDEHALVLAPGFLHLHPELQKNLHPEEVLHVDAGIGADRLQHRALLADHHGLLGLLFNIHGRADSGELASSFAPARPRRAKTRLFLDEWVDPDRHRKRQLIARLI